MQTRNLIAGQWVSAADGSEFDVVDPGTDKVIATVPRCGQKETAQAIDAAADAFPMWAAQPGRARFTILRKLADFMMRDQDRLARLMTNEQGKPFAEAAGEVAYAASFIEWAAEEAKRVYGETIPASVADKRILVLRQPIGVTACITPWNFPLAMIARKLGPSLAAGNTLIVKPAEKTPLSAIALAELAIEAGMPAGVVNVITGDAQTIGDELLGNPKVRKLSFTGSTVVGKLLLTKSAQNLTRLSLELGGHAPFVVFDDADLDAAVQGAVATKYRNMGQTCVCANRFYVQDGIYDAFAEKLAEASQQLKVGYGMEDGVHIGPLINDAAVAKVQRHVEDACSRGGKLLTGGNLTPVPGMANRFFQPTVIDGLTDDMLINHEETFGPVCALRRFTSEQQAIAMANDSIYGLASYVYTRDASRLIRVAEALECGIVGANDAMPSTAQAPFGGVKQSGFGREGGKYVMDEYTQIKYISLQL